MLTDFEATRKSLISGEYLDLCNDCFRPISKQIKVKERVDLLKKKDLEDYDK